MKWSKLKSRILEHMAESVKDRFDFHSISYNYDDGGRGVLLIDGTEFISMCFNKTGWHTSMYYDFYFDEEELEELTETNFKDWDLFQQRDFHKSLFEYLNMSIDEILETWNPIVKAFGMLDKRVGKRRLKTINVENENLLVQRLYILRCIQEGIKTPFVSAFDPEDLTKEIEINSEYEKAKLSDEDSQKFDNKLISSKNTRDLHKLISLIEENNISEDELDTAMSKMIYKAFQESDSKEKLKETLLFLDKNTKLFSKKEYVKASIAISKFSKRWKRDIKKWNPETHNSSKQFASLLRYFFADYSIPEFMDSVWLSDEINHQEWYIHIGDGKNIRTADNLPIKLTKKEAHHFLNAPAEYNVIAAIRWGQIHSLAGDKSLCDAILETPLLNDFRDNQFALSVLKFFINNPMLDKSHVNPIIDYIWNQKYENRIVFVERGVAQEIEPEKPNFSMRGRSVDTLLRDVEEWHRRLGRDTENSKLQWGKSSIKPFKFIEGSKENKNMKIWKIHELLTSQELIDEGKAQEHCVASYAKSCSIGKVSIWTMDLENEEGKEKLLTIELNNSDQKIKQIRGKRNRLASQKEMDIIKRWANQEEIILESYLK